MYQCPKCGAEYTVLPDICAQCGMHISPEDGLSDPFAAALEQEQKSKEQQQEQYAGYLKLRDEKMKQRQQDAALQAAAEEIQHPEDDELPEPLRKMQTGSSKPSKKNNRKWIVLAVLAVIGLFIYAGITLRNSLKPENRRTDGFAFYMKDHALWFYRDDSGETIRLTERNQPDNDLPDSYMQKLTQLSEDGSRVYYPKDINGNECTIAYRELDKPKKEYQFAQIRMFPDYNPSVMETGRLNEKEAFQFTDMLPPYICSGDAVFYLDSSGALNCKQSDGTYAVLNNHVIRYWKTEGMNGIYYLAVSRPQDYNVPDEFYPETVGSEKTPWSVSEYAVHPCQLFYCSDAGNIRAIYPFVELQILGWSLPYTGNDRYFYFWTQTDEGAALLYQADLVQQGFVDIIDYALPESSVPQLLCAYPDGSCYYETVTSPALSSEQNTFLHYFDRKEAQTHEMVGIPTEEFYDRVDICRTDPYAAVAFAFLNYPRLYHCYSTLNLSDSSPGNSLMYNKVQFDTQYPVLILMSSGMISLYSSSFPLGTVFPEDGSGFKIEFSLPDDDSTAEQSEYTSTDESALIVYYLPMNEDAAVDYIPMPKTVKNGTYFAHVPDESDQNGSRLTMFCWDQKNSRLLWQDNETCTIDRILRRDGSLFTYSVRDHSVSVYKDGAIQWINCAETDPDQWGITGKDTLFAVNKKHELLLCSPDILRTVDAADRLCSTGTMPHKSENQTEVSE